MLVRRRPAPSPPGTRDHLTGATVGRYAIGSVGTAGFATLPGLVLVYYLTDTLGVAAAAAGAIVAVAKIWDVLIDPVIGTASDRSLRRHGSRRPMMIVGAVALPILFALTFAVPAALATPAAALWVAAAFLLTATAFSLFQVPYIALPAELTDRYDERTRLLTARVVVLTVGILAFGAGGPALREIGGSDRVGYLVMAVVAGCVIGVSLLIATRSAPRAAGPRGITVGAQPDADTDSTPLAAYRAAVTVLRRSRPLRLLVGAFLLQGLATGLMLADGQYIATWILDDEGAVSVLFAALIAPALVFAPVWGAVARRIGKESGFFIATVIFAVATIGLCGLRWSPGWWVYPVIGIAGAAYAGMQSLPMAMIPDVISDDERRHGPGSAGIVGGVWTAGETTGMALGAVVLTVFLTLGGYVSSEADTDITQPAAATTAMIVAFSIVPAALAAGSLVLIRRYPLRRSDIDSDQPRDSDQAGDGIGEGGPSAG
ncbi:MFS transporter [Gordonia sp. ABSL11-1]|uniref:MFS transporter n=1 Tax=Gordonia sp. ABSL11-1 TaxID=3053924 RepID=UPI002572B58D|nr:MFS transporter [Gordonia sp. ABSL11-1]MDL9947801.1 MFS transporter [Gordonia sp. ABSL11-1]